MFIFQFFGGRFTIFWEHLTTFNEHAQRATTCMCMLLFPQNKHKAYLHLSNEYLATVVFIHRVRWGPT
jgi:hypothetical protein